MRINHGSGRSHRATQTFLSTEMDFDLNKLVASEKLERILAMEEALNAVYTNDETKNKFQLLARQVFKKYKALMPDKILNNYATAKDAINAIYTAIEGNVESADVAGIMKKIQDVIDESIENMVQEPTHDEGKITDLSNLNFRLLEEHFLKQRIKMQPFNR